jgi:hypothetical protein
MCGEKGHIGLQCPSAPQFIPTNYGQWYSNNTQQFYQPQPQSLYHAQPQQLIPYQKGTYLQIQPPQPPSDQFSGNTASSSGPQINVSGEGSETVVNQDHEGWTMVKTKRAKWRAQILKKKFV